MAGWVAYVAMPPFISFPQYVVYHCLEDKLYQLVVLFREMVSDELVQGIRLIRVDQGTQEIANNIHPYCKSNWKNEK